MFGGVPAASARVEKNPVARKKRRDSGRMFSGKRGRNLRSTGKLLNGAEKRPIRVQETSRPAQADERDPSAWERYRANRLRVVPQLKYRPGHNLAIDLVFFINGVPVATVEVETDFTQSADAAVQQYMPDRQPVDLVSGRKEPLLTFRRGAVVHFAMSDSDVRMSTKLDGLATHFLPFNKGRDGRSGNPLRDDGGPERQLSVRNVR